MAKVEGRARVTAGQAAETAPTTAPAKPAPGKAEQADPIWTPRAKAERAKAEGLTPLEAREQVERLAAKPQIERSDLVMRHAPSSASSVELLVDGKQFYPRILQDIAGAKTSVHINQFGFKDSPIAHQFAEALKAKAREGVEVRLVVDRSASAVTGKSKQMYEEMVKAGVQVVTNDGLKLLDRDGPLGAKKGPIDTRFDEIGHQDHRKLFVVDGKTAYNGGAGIDQHFADGRFHDVMVRVEGESVSQLQSTFLSSFKFLGGDVPRGAALDKLYPAVATKGGIASQVMHNVPGEGHLPITADIGKQIAEAKTSLDVMNPYVVDGATIDGLVAAAKRGVNVRLVVPAHPNNAMTSAAQRHEYARLMDAGVKIYEHPAMVHAKVMVRDGQSVLVGTANLDAMSLKQNYELNLRFDDPATAEKFRSGLFEPDIAKSKPAVVDTGAFARLRNAVFSKLAPWL